jgi:glycosyltransferase involved in cell wall biosynthesis
VILSPRPLQPLYNVHLLVDAMAEVIARVPSAVLVVTEYNCDPGYAGSLRQRVAALGLEGRVRFVGTVSAAEMPALHSLAEIEASIPSSDGLPQSLFEAMACGTPAVLGRLAAYREVVTDGESALLADLEPQAIAGALVRLLGDEALRGRLAQAGLERVREVAYLPSELRRVDALYRDVVARGGARERPQGRLLDFLGLLLR